MARSSGEGLWADLEAASRAPGPLMTITKAQYGALFARRTEMTQVPDWVDAPMPGYHWRPDAPDGPHAFLAAGDEWGAFIFCATCGEVRRVDPPLSAKFAAIHQQDTDRAGGRG